MLGWWHTQAHCLLSEGGNLVRRKQQFQLVEVIRKSEKVCWEILARS